MEFQPSSNHRYRIPPQKVPQEKQFFSPTSIVSGGNSRPRTVQWHSSTTHESNESALNRLRLASASSTLPTKFLNSHLQTAPSPSHIAYARHVYRPNENEFLIPDLSAKHGDIVTLTSVEPVDLAVTSDVICETPGNNFDDTETKIRSPAASQTLSMDETVQGLVRSLADLECERESGDGLHPRARRAEGFSLTSCLT